MVLSVLADGANYDYLIQKHIREPGHGGGQLLVGTLYSLLHRLESDGAIRSKWDAKTGRNRKWHELTEAGDGVCKQWSISGTNTPSVSVSCSRILPVN